MVQRLISVQPGDFKTSSSIDKSIEVQGERYLMHRFSFSCVVGSEVPCLISIFTNNVHLLSKAGEIHAPESFASFAPFDMVLNVDGNISRFLFRIG